jgi:hypothetical protein
LLSADEVFPEGNRDHFVGWDGVAGGPVVYDPSSGYAVEEERLSLRGEFEIRTTLKSRPCST